MTAQETAQKFLRLTCHALPCAQLVTDDEDSGDAWATVRALAAGDFRDAEEESGYAEAVLVRADHDDWRRGVRIELANKGTRT